MYQITTEEIPQEIIDKMIPLSLELRNKLVRKVNESYQYNIECYRQATDGDYTFITKLLEWHIYNNIIKNYN